MSSPTGIILAGGFGHRITKLTSSGHKSLLSLPDGETIIGRLIRQFVQHGVGRVVIVHFVPVVEALMKEVGAVTARTKADVVLAPQDPTVEYGTMFALRCGLRAVSENAHVIVVEGDVVCADQLIAKACQADHTMLFINDTLSSDPEAMKAQIEGGRVFYLAKTITGYPESSAVMRFAPPDWKRYVKETYNTRVAEPFFEDTLNLIAAKSPYAYATTSDDEWIEVDTSEDWQRALMLWERWNAVPSIAKNGLTTT